MLKSFTKISIYKQEKARIQKAIQDSLNALVQLKSDSTQIALNPDEESEKLTEEVFGSVVADTKIVEESNPVLNNEISDPKNKLE